MNAKIVDVETFACAAGWRNYQFVKVTTSDGVVGWSEYNEEFGNPGITAIIGELKPRIVGRPLGDHERLYFELRCATRPAGTGVVGQALGAVENALLDAKAKTLGVPCYELLGGKIRERLQVYWSHCGTWRISRQPFYGPPVSTREGVVALGREVRERGFGALKTNIYSYSDGKAVGWATGFGVPFAPDLNVPSALARGLREHLEAFREGAGPDVGIFLDLNFNARTEGYLAMVRELADLELAWIELDLHVAQALATVRSQSRHAIASGETLVGLAQFLPFFELQALDVAVIDLLWNGAWQAMKIAGAADAYGLNVAPHNFYGHLATMMNAHFAAAVPNLSIVELDVDRVGVDEALFTHEPKVEAGYLVIEDRPGWGCEPIEEVIRAHPANTSVYPQGLITHGPGEALGGARS